MEKIKKINEFYSERINEVQLKLDHIHDNLEDSEIVKGLLDFLKIMDKESIEGIYEDAIDYLTELIDSETKNIEEIEELSSDDENPTFVKKFEEV